MIRAVALLLLAASALAAPDEKRIRTALYELLKEPKAEARKKIAESLADVPVGEARAALLKGPLYPRDAAEAKDLVRIGGGVGGYAFEVDGKSYGYALHVPSGYDPAKGSAVLLDPGHGTWAKMAPEEKVKGLDYWRDLADTAGGRDWLIVRTEIVEQIGPDARGLPEEEGNLIFQRMFRDLATRYHFDPDRIYVTGLSQTGFWAWELGHCRADRFAGLVPMSAVTWEVKCHANLLAVPVYVLHGAKDKVCPVGQPRETCGELARIGVNVRYHELPGAGHDGNVWSTLPSALTWLKEFPRERYPKRVSKGLQTAKDGWCYWIRIDRLDDEGSGRAGEKPVAGIDGELEGQQVRLHSEGVAKITLCFAPEMVNLDEPVTVTWNGRTVFEGKVERSLAMMLDLVYDKTDWKATFEAAIELKAP